MESGGLLCVGAFGGFIFSGLIIFLSGQVEKLWPWLLMFWVAMAFTFILGLIVMRIQSRNNNK